MFHHIIGLLDVLSLEDGTNMLSWNLLDELPIDTAKCPGKWRRLYSLTFALALMNIWWNRSLTLCAEVWYFVMYSQKFLFLHGIWLHSW